MPRLTVLMSCYNASRYLSEAIESILNQTYSDFEFIVVNDGSTDDTLDIIRRYASQDDRIILLDKKNTGLADSLSCGLRVAQAEWTARLDADDISLPDRFARQVAFLEGNRSVVLAGTGCVLIDERGTPGRNYRYPMRHDAIVSQICGGGSPFPHSSVMFHRQTAIRIGGYNRRFARCQDVDLWLRLSRVGKIACLPEVLLKIRKHDACITNFNNGPESVIMGMAARVCHLLRVRGTPDPSQGSDAVWREFLDWLFVWMDKHRYCQLGREWSNIRQNCYAAVQSGGRLRGALELARGLLASGHVCKIIRHKLSRSSVPSRLAHDWIQACARGPRAGKIELSGRR